MLLRPNALQSFIRHSKQLAALAQPTIPGFLRVEHNVSKPGQSFLPGSPEGNFVHWENGENGWRTKVVAGVRYAQPDHPYQALWIATKKQLLRWNESCGYLSVPPDAGNYAHFANDLIYREWSACLQLFEKAKGCSVRKVVPVSADFDDFLVQHLSDRTHLPPFAPAGGFVGVEKLKAVLLAQPLSSFTTL